MLIDWFTVIAQLINFLILVFLLNKFLYRPILKAVDQREKKIADQIQSAKEKEAQAILEQEKFVLKNEEFNSNYKSLLNDALNEINQRKDELLEKARKDSMDLRNRLLESFEMEKKMLANEIISKTRKEVFSISRKVLSDLASRSLEEKMIETFLERMEKQDIEDIKKMRTHPGVSESAIIISTSYTVPEIWRFKIQQTLEPFIADPIDKTKKKKINIQFNENVEEINGIELAMNGFKFAWSISDYLAQMEGHLADLLRKYPELNKLEKQNKDSEFYG